ncbi:ferritin-like domain-containing protein [Hymenobacter aquaticus]|uniref:Ferritin-like domain-containing protein n=1 Tax=Hymenobacter aquaticus TaxID=1867101 RepID=A0A4Z0PYR0_9BACT|nr:ferritin-like domain-containing protein [Hymenobacter aquaticus]TGE22033.1 ferritin-like domain-containing protein [Hymenobacter aquaticus]
MSESGFSSSFLARTMRRRSFFRVAGATVAASTLVLAGCGDDSEIKPTDPGTVISIGSGENGLLNYVYLLEQLEAAFYQKVVDAKPAFLSATELAAFTDLRDHEVIHREFFKQLLGSNGIGAFEFNFSSVTFSTREGVLGAARTLEDLGVAAYNGAGKLIATKNTLNLLGKIASVEARHAALIHDLLGLDPFADVVEASGAAAGLGAVLTPKQVVTAAASFFLPYTVDVSSLPTA